VHCAHLFLFWVVLDDVGRFGRRFHSGPYQHQYSDMLQNLVRDWRIQFQQPRLPFGAVTLAPYYQPHDASFAKLRLQQINLTKYVPDTFVVNNLDCGDPAKANQVHSPYKQKQGIRAANGIAAMLGLRPTVEYLSPSYKSASYSTVKQSADAGLVTLTVTVVLKEAGLYQKPIVLQNVTCPPTANDECESFAVMEEKTGAWHVVTSFRTSGDTALALVVEDWPEGVGIVATRAMFAGWPLVVVTNAAGLPLLPWWENVTKKEVP
jgi:hypothetical protein